MIGKRLESFDLEIFNEAVKFFSLALNINESPIPLEVSIVDNLGRGDVAGVCTANIGSNDEVSSVSIQIKSGITILGMIEALAHEMCHAEQFMTGKLNFYNQKKYLFGFIPFWQRVRRWKSTEIDHNDYYANPAEVEAFIKQRAYTLEFLKTIEDRLMPKNVFDHIMHERKDISTFISHLDMADESQQI